MDILQQILERKRRENARRRKRMDDDLDLPRALDDSRAQQAYAALSRAPGEPPRVIAEIKFHSPSAGVILSRRVGAVQEIARAYAEGGAAAVSVLCDRPGFGGTPLDLRRVAGAVGQPLLFKEFVLDCCQIALARRLGAHMVLLLVRALDPAQLRALVAETHRQGMAPVVEAADRDELERALDTEARIVGVNARDLRTFRVDPRQAARMVEQIPHGRIAVYMSGIAEPEDFRRVAHTRADAVLVGESLMRASSPADRLRELLA